jgi:NAD(P)-dependent dehydrogenase (short-subunit alcohol dehydrogenase family)
MSKVWLVTGSASGLGRNIAEAVLAGGDRLVATARDPGRKVLLLRLVSVHQHKILRVSFL